MDLLLGDGHPSTSGFDWWQGGGGGGLGLGGPAFRVCLQAIYQGAVGPVTWIVSSEMYPSSPELPDVQLHAARSPVFKCW